ncbi:MAG: peptidoglycan-associated lipoprotein Pal [Bdellovibrionota bacterium]
MTKKVFQLLTLAVVMGLTVTGCAKKNATSVSEAGDKASTSTSGADEDGFDATNITDEEAKAILASLPTVYFDFDQYALNTTQRKQLKTVAEVLKKNSTVRVSIQGHCDERGSTEYNLALGDRRAQSVLEYLEDLGVSQQRLEGVSFGEERPVATGDDESAWARNRRAELVVVR